MKFDNVNIDISLLQKNYAYFLFPKIHHKHKHFLYSCPYIYRNASFQEISESKCPQLYLFPTHFRVSCGLNVPAFQEFLVISTGISDIITRKENATW